MKRLIFHVDVNSAFLSWTAVERVKNGKSDLRLIPSCISGSPDKRTSVVLAKSLSAKRFGVTTGESINAALRKCPDLVIAPRISRFTNAALKHSRIYAAAMLP